MDLIPFVGEEVKITICRKHKYHRYVGKLIIVSRGYVCLEVDGRRKWITAPKYFRDSIKKVKKT